MEGQETHFHGLDNTKVKKAKAVILHAWIGPEGSRKLRFPDFMTKAQYGSKVPLVVPDGNIIYRAFLEIFSLKF